MLTTDPQFKLVNERYPHIGEKIKSLWGDKEYNIYLSELFTDTRGSIRHGFPVDIASALFKLMQEHEFRFPGEKVVVRDIWNLNNE